MLVTEATGRQIDTCAPGPTGVQAAKTEPDKNHGPRPVTVHGSLIGIIEREIMRSVGMETPPKR